MTTTTAPRGIRNHNPGNIDKGNNKWQGLAPNQSDSRFATFTDPTWGIRAMAVLLINYQDKYGINTVDGIINRWAPSVENDTVAYIAQVCAAAKVKPLDILDLHSYNHLCPIVEAIIRHENGRGPKSTLNTWYDRSVIDMGLQRAGVVKKAAEVAKVPVTKETVAATGTGALGAAQLADVAPQVALAVDSHQEALNSGSWTRIIIGVMLIGLAVFVAYSQVKKHRDGLVP